MADQNPQTSNVVVTPEALAAARAQIAAEDAARAAEAKANTPIDNPEGYPLFVSTTGKPVMLATLSGHSASVGEEPTPLHPRFHRMAQMYGVVHVEVADHYKKIHNLDKPRKEKTKRALMKEEITKMVAEAADDLKRQAELFTGDGMPNAQQLTSRCGFHVSAAERDEAWAEFDAGDEGPSE